MCGSDDGIESSAARGWPRLNSILTGPVEQLGKRRFRFVGRSLRRVQLGSDAGSSRFGIRQPLLDIRAFLLELADRPLRIALQGLLALDVRSERNVEPGELVQAADN